MKKLICTVLTVVLVLTLFVPASFAIEDNYIRIVNKVERTNEEIENLIDKALIDVDVEREKYDNDNQEKLDKKIQHIIDKLVDDTNKLAEKMIKSAAKVEIQVMCEYVEVEIGGQKVLIDPLKVIGFDKQ